MKKSALKPPNSFSSICPKTQWTNPGVNGKKSRVRETNNLSTDADSSTAAKKLFLTRPPPRCRRRTTKGLLSKKK